MMRNLGIFCALIVLGGLAGCGGSGSSSRAHLKAIDAFATNRIDVSTDANPVGFDLGLGDVTAYTEVGAGLTDILTLQAGTNNVQASQTIDLGSGVHYTAIPYQTAGPGGTPDIATFIDDTANP